MIEIKRISKGQMPPANKYIAVYAGNRPWIDSDDRKNVHWKIAKMVVGISVEERMALAQSDRLEDRKRAKQYRRGDEEGNNLVPYCFDEFGVDWHFGQDIDAWFELPEMD